MEMSEHGKFNKAEEAAFAPGGKMSTPHKREEEAVAGDFLSPADRKYPYKIRGRISCNLLKAAMTRAKQNNEGAIFKKAKDLFEDNC